MTVSVDILQQLPLLKGLPKLTLDELSKQGEIRAFNKREVVFNKGSAPTHLMFLYGISRRCPWTLSTPLPPQ